MRLRRITEHVNAQNWFAVWLDFVIVVVGVFIGCRWRIRSQAAIGSLNESRRCRCQP